MLVINDDFHKNYIRSNASNDLVCTHELRVKS